MILVCNPFGVSAGSADFFETLRLILSGEYDEWTLISQGLDRDELIGNIPNTRVTVSDLSGAPLACILYASAIGPHLMRVGKEAEDSFGEERKYLAAQSSLALLRMKQEVLEFLVPIIAVSLYPQFAQPGQNCRPVIYQFFVTRLKKFDFDPLVPGEADELKGITQQFKDELFAALGPDPYINQEGLERDHLAPPCACKDKACPKHDLLDVRSDKYLSSLFVLAYEQYDRFKELTERGLDGTSAAVMYANAYNLCRRLIRYRALILKPLWFTGTDCVLLAGPVIENVPDIRHLNLPGLIFFRRDSGTNPDSSDGK